MIIINSTQDESDFVKRISEKFSITEEQVWKYALDFYRVLASDDDGIITKGSFKKLK